MILDEILAHKRREVDERRAARPLTLSSIESADRVKGPGDGSSPQSSATYGGTFLPGGSTVGPRGGRFGSTLRQPGVSFIAEIKRKSPSGGELRPGVSAAELAHVYASAGAAALSVLTDKRYFGGTDADLGAAQLASGLPALRKDFVIDPYQILEARLLGADAVLLIVRALADAELRDLLELTHQCGMDALVETHSAAEVDRALQAGARIIGVNNRDLDTLQTDISLAPRLRSLVPAECLFIAESGISRPADVAVLRDAGVDAVLIGEALLREPDPGAKLRSLIAAGVARGAMARLTT